MIANLHYIKDKNSYYSCLKGEKDNAMFISLSCYIDVYYHYGNGKDKTNGVLLSTFVVSAEVVDRSRSVKPC